MTKDIIEDYPIDAVILWVDGNDEKHKAKMLPFIEDKTRVNAEKFRTRYDHVNEIQYTIDSILKYAPYVRNIHIITDNQIPDFLKNSKDGTYKKVSIVDHKVVFKDYEDYLPTFNCRPIETCLFRIPGLAEHFIYFNDDFFLINDTKPSDFFKNGLPILRGKWLKFDKDIFYKKFKKPRVGHKSIQQNAARLAGFNKYYNFKHTPHPLRKSTFETYFEANEDVLIENIKHRFRKTSQFTPQGLANHLEIKNKTCYFKDDLQLMYFRSYKKPLYWYKFKLNLKTKGKLFLGLQSLDRSPPHILEYILEWLEKRTS
ncbi:Stealth CR1 domain-containing protein [Winogradskyella psychrotolerans]|uniref:Stealth CR1 domain-containing protein n=1 Tax=Winogradskyella psychrotolerans TaxID=1344585 RepID=UPI001C071362|nr:Stealth CR1 domain-containing protein [Winogradskyella psychrotolerans]MBU2928973.1 Stealth CR1 domain-containing protein [Winogradskyella psychrotolerans]